MLSRAAIRAPAAVSRFQRTMAVDARLAELGLKLPTAAKPVAAYVMCTRVGNMIYTGGYRQLCCVRSPVSRVPAGASTSRPAGPQTTSLPAR